MSETLVYLIHWDDEGRDLRAGQLQNLGYDVENDLPPGPKLLRELENLSPHAIVIDLTRIPSQGRDLGIGIRKRKGTRSIPLVFVGGDRAKVDKLKQILPDAYYSKWEGVAEVIDRAIRLGVSEDAVVPDSVFAAYSGKPLLTKLGVKDGDKFLCVNEPGDFRALLGDQATFTIINDLETNDYNLAIWFVKSKADLDNELDAIVDASKQSPVWVSWPKKSSGLKSNLTQSVVRKVCMQKGMVDYKVCSIDTTWSALLFTWRG
jgi:CheY-like chemotaxis protein